MLIAGWERNSKREGWPHLHEVLVRHFGQGNGFGQVYERFLGKIIRLTAGHQAKVEEKPEVRKAGWVSKYFGYQGFFTHPIHSPKRKVDVQ